jgi:hypothetical protein
VADLLLTQGQAATNIIMAEMLAITQVVAAAEPMETQAQAGLA